MQEEVHIPLNPLTVNDGTVEAEIAEFVTKSVLKILQNTPGKRVDMHVSTEIRIQGMDFPVLEVIVSRR